MGELWKTNVNAIVDDTIKLPTSVYDSFCVGDGAYYQ